MTIVKKPVLTLKSAYRCIVDRINIDKQVSEDWPSWSFAGLAGHRKEYMKRNVERMTTITRQLLKKGITQEQIDTVISEAKSGLPFGE